jgi:pyruvyl transferase EpsO
MHGESGRPVLPFEGQTSAALPPKAETLAVQLDQPAAQVASQLDVLRASTNRLTQVLDQVIPAGQSCALVDQPDYSNVGDSAIWLGQRTFLRQRRMRIAYSCSIKTYDEGTLRAAMPRGTVLINGGGNFGTLWPHHQEFRERLLERLRDYRIVQLPQSIHYGDEDALRRTAALIRNHPAFTLLVRDEAALRIARDQLGANTLLCPDSALLLAGAVRRAPPDVDCLVLARTDKERAFTGIEAAFQGLGISVAAADWLDEPRGTLHRIRDRLTLHARRPWAGSMGFQWSMLLLWDQLAQQRLQRGCRLLSRGRIVVTDRLHAHILCTLLGIPHIVLDNNCGKLSGFIRCWTAGHPLCHLADSVQEATRIAGRLLASPSTS